VPAAAVIPAPIAYINVVAVKKLVVGFRGRVAGGRSSGGFGPGPPPFTPVCALSSYRTEPDARRKSSSLRVDALPRITRAQGPSVAVTVNKTACSKQVACPLCMSKHGITRHRPTGGAFVGFSHLAGYARAFRDSAGLLREPAPDLASDRDQ